MKRIIHGLAAIMALLAVLMLAGCSAETLMSTGESLSRLSSAGFGTGGDVYVSMATETIDGFIESYEDCILWDGSCTRTVNPETGEETVNGDLSRIPNSDKAMYELLGNVISDIQKTKDSKADDSELRKALDTLYKDYDGVKKSYKGQTIEWFGHVNLGEIINCVQHSLVGMIPIGFDLSKYYPINLPFPVQGSDLSSLLTYARDNVMKILSYSVALVNKSKRGGGGGGESKFKVEDLKYIPESIESYVSGRKDVTVGDKIAFCFIYDVLQTALNVLDRYVEQHPDEDADTRFDSLNATWILGNCDVEIDRLMAELDVIAYIYDFNLDVAGLVGKILGE